jgi:hypothetical protein
MVAFTLQGTGNQRDDGTWSCANCYIGPELNPKILYRILHFAAGSRYPSLIPDHVSSDLLEVHPAAHTHNTDAPFH